MLLAACIHCARQWVGKARFFAVMLVKVLNGTACLERGQIIVTQPQQIPITLKAWDEIRNETRNEVRLSFSPTAKCGSRESGRASTDKLRSCSQQLQGVE